MRIIGITGGVASGKNFICEIFQKLGAKIFDADAVVHDLLKNDQEIIKKIAAIFPLSLEEVGKGTYQISRRILGEIVFQDKDHLQSLERIIHPEIRQKYLSFLQESRKKKVPCVILNIPLLLESRSYKCDLIIAIKCSERKRMERFILRHKKNFPTNQKEEKLIERFFRIKSSQMNDLKRFRKADFVINNNLPKKAVTEEVKNIVKIANLCPCSKKTPRK